MMIKPGKAFERFMKNIDKMPQFADTVARAGLKKLADQIIQEFRMGIKKNELGLLSLEPTTVLRKRLLGFKQPSTPLYGRGGTDKRSYRNMMNIKKTKKGYTIYQSQRRHWKSKAKLRTLFLVHEYGATINTGNGMIRIPPRPAFKRATEKVQKKFAKSIREKMLKDIGARIYE